MVGLKVMLLGGFEARLSSGAPLSLPTKKAQALLAYLAARPGQSYPRDKLAAMLWGEKRDDQARGGLRNALVGLRKALAGTKPPTLRIEGQTLALNPVGVDVDVATFERLVAEGTPHALEDAAELYRGDLLLGFTVNEPLFEEWLVPERERLRETALNALARLLAQQTKAARTERAIQTAVRLLGLDPLQEAVHRTLMRLYARQGRRGAALKQYQVCVGAMQRELGTAPEAETKELYQELLRRPARVPEASDPRGDRRARPARTVGPAPPDLPAAETPLFGRQVELGRLRELLEAAIGGRGNVATVVGEAGIGKTRLVTALVADAMSQGCRVLIGRCHESDSILPFGPWVDACRSGQVSHDEEILGTLHPTRRAELARLLPETGMAGLPSASDSALPLFESVAQLIEQIAARQPVVLVLEDLHWADEMSLRLLAFVSRRIPAWPALLVATAREEELADASRAERTLRELSTVSQTLPFTLSPLSRSDTALLVRALTRVGSGAPALAHVEEQIWAMSEGNPFVAVEAIRALGEDRQWDPARATPGALALPSRVRELVAWRLDRLSARSQQLAAVAAVIGRQFDFTLLQSASGMEERDAAEAIEEMVRHHVLQAVGNQLDFAHDRIRHVAYGRLLPARRRLLHRAVAERLEVVSAGVGDATETHDQDRLGEQIAHHALSGEVWDKALRYCWQAATKATGRAANRAAVALFDQALIALGHMPETRETLEWAIDLRFDLRSALFPLGEFERILGCLREAEDLARRLDDQRRLGQLSVFLCHNLVVAGHPTEALGFGQRAQAIAESLGDVRLQVTGTLYLGAASLKTGDYRRAEALLLTVLRLVEGDLGRERLALIGFPAVMARCYLPQVLAEQGRFEEGIVHAQEGIRLAEALDHPYSLAFGWWVLAYVHITRGELLPAVDLLERGQALSRERDLTYFTVAGAASLGYAYALSGRTAESIPLLEHAVSAVETMGHGALQPLFLMYLGEAYALAGRPEDALSFAGRALTFARARGQRGYEAMALRLLGDVTARVESPERAHRHYRDALTLAVELGMRPLVAHCHLGLARVYRRAGPRPEAREHLTTAMTLYREMDMQARIEKAEEAASSPRPT
ncbi:MAG TPA: AAA family ATPase [Candidatus Limnocylindrales bacterium]|nr:AAA family ATPase [Candidatus Limnocylindrales bacterium]